MDVALRNIYITGDLPLVEEYSALCSAKGFAVEAKLPVGTQPIRLPTGVKRVRKPSKTTAMALELTNIDLRTKKANLAELERAVQPTTPILSSSVTVSVRQQAKWTRHPQRLIGIGALPSLLSGPLIEVAPSPTTDQAAISAARELAKALGKQIAFVKDATGLVLPRILCAVANEALFSAAENVAPRSDIDTALKLGANYPFGPFELVERLGLDQIRAVLEALQRTVDKTRYKPAPLMNQKTSSKISERK